MEITKSLLTPYAFTIKDNRKVVNESRQVEYDKWFDKLGKLGINMEYQVCELDSMNRLHIHGVILIPKGFYRKRLIQGGLHIKLVELYNSDGWLKYMLKEQQYHDECPGDYKDTKRIF